MGSHRPDTAERKAALEFNRLIEQSSFGTEGARLLRKRPEQPEVGAAVSAHPARLPPELADRFSLVRELPAGGEADMLVVTDAAGTEVVLKLYRAGIVPSPDTWAALHVIDSPHVAHLVDWGDAGGRAFEVMEYVGTGTLCDLIEDRSRDDLGSDTITETEIVRQVAAGLNALHRARVIHRDLKPANILVRSRSPLELALADFGLSRYLENTTVFSAAGHTLAYTAPETFAGHVSPARDWWSLGMIVRELATGEPPFGGLSTEVVMLTLAARPIDCLQVTDPRLRLLCRGLLTRDPAARWGAAEVARWLAGESPQVREDAAAQQASYQPRQHGTSSVTWRGQCPYRGLAPYGEHDADVFCGREQLTASLLATVAGQLDRGGLVIVTGPSGAGKSSLLRAGLIPGMAHGDLGPGSQGWPRMLMTPGRSPLEELAVHLATFLRTSAVHLRELLDDRPGEAARRLRQATRTGTAPQPEPQDPAAQKRLILIIDQFEEIFTLAGDAERTRFIEALDCLAEPDGDLEGPAAIVILGLRADFFAQCTGYAPLARALQSASFLVTPMTRNDIRAAIIQPAALAGLTFEEGLVDVIVADAGSVSPQADLEAGMLPFLSQAMLETWQHRTGTTLTLRAYQAGGGVSHSIQNNAERTYEGLNPGQQRAMRTLLCRMVAIGTDGRMTRRALDGAEIVSSAADNDTITALEALTRARLVVIQQDAAEIVHEALLHAWPRFRQWLGEDTARIQLLGRLAQSSRAWIEGGKDPAYLYSGTRLAAALEWPDDQRGLAVTHREFLAASQRLHLRQSRRRRSLLAALVALVLCSVSAAGIALHQAATAAAQRATALSEQVAYESQTVNDPTISALLAVAAWHIAPTSQAGNDLITAFTRENVTALKRTGSVSSLAFSPEGRTLVTADSDGTVRLWNAATYRQIGATLRISGGLTQVAYNPDGRILATADSDGTVRLWNMSDPARPVAVGQPLTGPTGGVFSVAFSPDGKVLATAGQGGPIIRLWNMSDPVHPVIVGLPLTDPTGGILSVAFSPDGRSLAAGTYDGKIRLWNMSDPARPVAVGLPLAGPTGGILSVAFSPDGRTLAAGSSDAIVRLWSTATGRQTGTLQTGSGNTKVTFSPDGRTLATASTDGTVRLWDTATHRQIGAPLTADGISEAAFSPDGKILATASVGATPAVQLWTLPTTTSATQLSQAICAKAGHNLTPTQWAQYIPDAPYQPSCTA